MDVSLPMSIVLNETDPKMFVVSYRRVVRTDCCFFLFHSRMTYLGVIVNIGRSYCSSYVTLDVFIDRETSRKQGCS